MEGWARPPPPRARPDDPTPRLAAPARQWVAAPGNSLLSPSAPPSTPHRAPRGCGGPRGTCGSGITSSFAGHFREGPAAGGGGGGGPLAPPARRRMPLSAPLLACHLARARSVMECGPMGRWGGGEASETAGPRNAGPEPAPRLSLLFLITNLEELRCPVICGKIKALVFNRRGGILVLRNRVSSHVST